MGRGKQRKVTTNRKIREAREYGRQVFTIFKGNRGAKIKVNPFIYPESFRYHLLTPNEITASNYLNEFVGMAFPSDNADLARLFIHDLQRNARMIAQYKGIKIEDICQKLNDKGIKVNQADFYTTNIQEYQLRKFTLFYVVTLCSVLCVPIFLLIACDLTEFPEFDHIHSPTGTTSETD